MTSSGRSFWIFQSTHPTRGGTHAPIKGTVLLTISIHPPHAGWDLRGGRWFSSSRNFNPPTPRGVGLVRCRNIEVLQKFQSTHPTRGGTVDLYAVLNAGVISIHPPHAGWDYKLLEQQLLGVTFQSTHPTRGGTEDFARYACQHNIFQSTHPTRGGTSSSFFPIPSLVFQSTHPTRGGTPAPEQTGRHLHISIHPPHAGWDSKSAQDHALTLLQKRQISSSPAGNDVVPGSHHLHFILRSPSRPVRTGRGPRVCSHFARPVTP